MTVLETENLTHYYENGMAGAVAAIENINVKFEKGEIVGIIGHTGSGKSTLLQHLNGLLKPDSGRVLLCGEDINKDKRTLRAARFRVGLCFQYPEYQLFEETVYKDISFGPKNMGLDSAEIDRRVRRAAEFVGLSEEHLKKSPFDLSGGEKRRAAIAGVMAMEPEVLILDEPTAGLDRAEERSFSRLSALIASRRGAPLSSFPTAWRMSPRLPTKSWCSTIPMSRCSALCPKSIPARTSLRRWGSPFRR